MDFKPLSEEEKNKLIEDLMNKHSSRNVNDLINEKITFGDKVADKFAEFAGSWGFIFGFLIIMLIWIVFNVMDSFKHFDEYPFILLNLALSCIAALQAPIIMMSQNRHEEKDRIKSQQDFETDEKAEIIIEEILRHTKKIQSIEIKQNEILEYLKENIKNR